MKTKNFRLFALIVFAIAIVLSCKKDESSGPSVTGYWEGSFYWEEDFSYEWNLEQNGEKITGNFQFEDGSGSTSISSPSQISGNEVIITQKPSGLYMEFEGTVNKERNKMSGNMSITYKGFTVDEISWNAKKYNSKSTELKSASSKTQAEQIIGLFKK